MQSAQSNMSMYAGRKRRRPVKRLTPTTGEVKTNPSKRHRDRLNTELDTLSSLLPLDEETVSKLDKLSILRLCVSYLRNKSYFKAIPNKSMLPSLADISRQSIETAPASLPVAGQTQPNQFDIECKQNDKEKDWIDLVSNEEGQMLIQALNGFVIVIQQNGQIFYVSSTIQDYLGFQDADVMHQCVFELIHKDDRLNFRQQMSADPIIPMSESSDCMAQDLQAASLMHYNDSVNRNFECRFRCLLDESSGFLKLKFSGKLRPLHGQRVRGKDGIPIDKDPPELALFALACPVEQYSIVEIHIRNTIFRTKHDLSFKPLATDKMGIEVLGYSELELIQLPGYHYIHYEDLIYLSDLHNNLLRKGDIDYCYFRLYRKVGKWMWVQVKPRLMYKNDQPDYIVSTHRPMSDEEGEKYHKQRRNPFQFPFKTKSSLYDMNNPYPPMPKEIINYINSGFKPQIGKEGGPPINFGAMGPPPNGGMPPGRGPPNGSMPPGRGPPNASMPTGSGPPPCMRPQNSTPKAIAVVTPRNMQPPNGFGSRPPMRTVVQTSLPGGTSNRVDTVQSFVGPDGVQNTILQTQVTRCTKEIQKLKIPDIGAGFSDADVMQVASMITDHSEQMLTDQLSSGVPIYDSDIPSFDDTIKPLDRLTDITDTHELLPEQPSQICQFPNVPKNTASVSCMQQNATEVLDSKERIMFQGVNSGAMNQQNSMSFASNSLPNQTNFQQICGNALQKSSRNLFPEGNRHQNTFSASGSKLHDMLTNPVHTTRQQTNPQKPPTDNLKRERTHTLEYLPNGPSQTNSAQCLGNSMSFQEIQTNQLMAQGKPMQSALNQYISPVVSNFETPGNHGMIPIENTEVSLQPNFSEVAFNTSQNLSSSSMPVVENQSTMVNGAGMISDDNQRLMKARNPYGMHELNQPTNNHFVNTKATGIAQNQMQSLASEYKMMNGNQGISNSGFGNLQNQRITQTGIGDNQQGMRPIQNHTIPCARNQGINSQEIPGNNQRIKTFVNQGQPNSQVINNLRGHGIPNAGSNHELVYAKNQGVPTTQNNPNILDYWSQGNLNSGNQLGMNGRAQGTTVPQNQVGVNGRAQGTTVPQNQVGVNARTQGITSVPQNPLGMNARTQGIMSVQQNQLGMNARTQEIMSVPQNQLGMNARTQGIMSVPQNQLGMNARIQGITSVPQNQVGMNARTQGIMSVPQNQLGMNSRTQGIQFTQNQHGVPGNQGISNTRNQILMNSQNSGMVSMNNLRMVNQQNYGMLNPGNQGFGNVAFQGMEEDGSQYSTNPGMRTSEMDQARIQQEMLELMALSGQGVKGHNFDPSLVMNRQNMVIANEQRLISANKMTMPKQMQNYGMNNVDMVYCGNEMHLNKQMDERNMRVTGEPSSRLSTDSGGTAYNSPLNIFDNYSSPEHQQLTPNSVFSSPPGGGDSPNTGLSQNTLPGDNCHRFY
ncbi:uncharacterized protein [Antedon mediterranea]|uniref:uncharacterized protein n=1 Tax=Antedon mediterranea TaxID=105859 RepID=UPI003AF9275D